jgi:hypothetical protein
LIADLFEIGIPRSRSNSPLPLPLHQSVAGLTTALKQQEQMAPGVVQDDNNMIKEEVFDDDEDGFNESKFRKVDSNGSGKQVSFQFRFLHDRVRQVYRHTSPFNVTQVLT